MFQLAFSTEIRQRFDSGKLNEKFVRTAAHQIQPIEGPVQVRLNDEVRGLANIRAVRSIERGEHTSSTDLKHLESSELEKDELDAGHFTLL